MVVVDVEDMRVRGRGLRYFVQAPMDPRTSNALVDQIGYA
jgi:hypothetical protein